ncbi:capsular exopolysaccharide family [Longilinea arvoryzae]|uniref:non-specific protein-tyrosine kinase n=1 Tax=Longilinea arvoryzae TaxID=360412 RepID=A0A0S7BDP0_9CHLR|nr:polysaccharide biosynthesis tyrosine autokinase [Longilinea arvoryzae]GAP13481.1 capsular exopolysaccharide family [Longilinea arvoryzae]
MTFNDYIAPLRKWWWLLVAATLVAAIASLLYSFTQPKIYQVRTTLMVGNSLNAANPNGGEYYLQQQLAGIYADIAYREPIRQATMGALGIDFLPEYSVRALPNSTLIEIVVNDTNPQRTAAVANELANQMINRSPTLEGEDAQVQQFLQDQLSIIRGQIETTRKDLESYQEQLTKLTSARQISEVQGQISLLESRLSNLQSTYAALLSNTQGGATNALSVIEQAEVPTQPVGPNRLMIVLLAAAVGLALSAIAAYVIEFLDDSVKGPEDIKRILDVPIVGEVGDFPPGKDPWSYVIEEPRSPVAHAFRVMRTNLDLLNPDEPLHSFLVTSAGMSEGKSTIAANLAVVMSQGDRRVICVDADFHRPMLHNVVSIDNEHGLSDVFKGSMELQDVVVPWNTGKLKLIPSGIMPPNPSELLESKKMNAIIDSLTQMADAIILDGPPFFLSDASALSTKVDCVVLVIRPGYTRKDAVRAMKEEIAKLRLKKVVVVLNRVPKSESYYSKYYPYEYEKRAKAKV